jgi:hypothetical protein
MFVEESSIVLEDLFTMTAMYSKLPKSLASLQVIVHVFLRVPLKTEFALGVLDHFPALQRPIFVVLCRTYYPNAAEPSIETWKLQLIHCVIKVGFP